jgi:thiamine-phosphate pyrophosphorylase
MTLPRLYPIVDTAAVEARGGDVVDAAAAILDAGAGILQWRCKSDVTAARFEQAERVVELCRRSRVPCIVNDRADVAMLLESAEACGVSLDYLALGPVFATWTKQKPDPVVGCDQLRRWRSLTSRPLVAIGGITRENALAALRAGADSVAVISDLLPETCSPAAVRRRVEDWLNLVNRDFVRGDRDTSG